MSISFETDFDPQHGVAVPVGPSILRVTAPNAGPYTFHGTNSYVLGEDSVVVVDPGPQDEAHLAALLSAIGGRRVEAVLLTHTHRDHTALTARLLEAVGRPQVLAEGPHRASRPLHASEATALDAAGDMELRPDRLVSDGEILDLAGLRIEAIATPGHTANHMAFALLGTGLLLSGDHVMAWSTTVVAPPDGSMADYMASLDRLLTRDETAYLPGHGGPAREPRRYLRGLRSHRRMRETSILERVKAGDQTIAAIVETLYRQTDPRLHKAAALSVLAHLEDLVASGQVLADGPVLLGTLYAPA